MTALNDKRLNITIDNSAFRIISIVKDCLNESGIKGYFVGGFIRDSILKRDSDDIDIAIAANALDFSPELAKLLNGKYIPMDKENKVARIVLKDAATAKIQHIDVSTIINNIEDDLSRRDFTINAIAIPLEKISAKICSSDIIDPFNGLDDIRGKTLRVVNDKSFEADPLRLLRAVRLAAETDFSIDSGTEALIKNQAGLINSVSGERIREELLKLLSAPETGDLFFYMEELGLISAVVPELIPSKGLEQPSEHYWDVFIHSIKTIDAIDYIMGNGEWKYKSDAIKNVPWSSELETYFNEKISSNSTRLILLKLTALLHDIAKPKMKFIDENGKIRFFGHPKEGAPMVAEIMDKLRFSNKEIRIVEEVTRHHLRPTQMTQMGMVTDHAIYRYFRDVGEVAIDTLFFTLADHLAARGPTLDLLNWQRHTAAVKYILEKHREQANKIALPRLISGKDIMKEFGLEEGPKIGELLETVREAQASGQLEDKQGALDYVRELLTG